jgi:hypothetical protein
MFVHKKIMRAWYINDPVQKILYIVIWQEHMIGTNEKRGRGKEHESPTQQIKNSNRSHGSRVTKFRAP